LKRAIGVHEAGELSKDGLFSYEEVECLGACEYAPVMRVDHRYEKDLTPQKIGALIAERRSPVTPLAVEPPHPPGSLREPGDLPAERGGEKPKPKPRARKPKSG
jgi:hypothetical protein